MGYKAYRLRQKNSSGTYDILLISSRSDLVQRFASDGSENGTVESALASLESTIRTITGGSGAVDLSTKADKVSGATADHFASLDANGNLKDSGKNASSFATASHNHTLANIVDSNNKSGVIVTDSNGKLIKSTAVTLTELNYLAGVKSKIQTQIDNVSTAATNAKTAADNAQSTANTAKSNAATAQSTANSAKAIAEAAIPATQKGANGGVAPLNSSGLIDSSYLPSYVDDVIEGYLSNGKFYKESGHTTEITGESGKIYVDLTSLKTYRYTGSAFVVISETIALGETSSTAYRGDRGKIAYEHSQATHARTDATKTAKSNTNGNILINGSETVVYTHPSYAGTKSTGSSTLAYGGKFDAVTALTLSNGHVSGYTLKTFTMPARPVNISFATSQPTDQQTNDLWFETVS